MWTRNRGVFTGLEALIQSKPSELRPGCPPHITSGPMADDFRWLNPPRPSGFVASLSSFLDARDDITWQFVIQVVE